MRTAAKTRATTPMAYVERVNLAIDYVVSHLAEPLRLEDVSRAALLSPFHFHRVFQALVGVTLAEFVKRLRLEKALFMMAHARRPSLTTIALTCGFSSSSDFSRCFRQRFGVPRARSTSRVARIGSSAVRASRQRSRSEPAERLHRRPAFGRRRRTSTGCRRGQPGRIQGEIRDCPHARWRTSASAIRTEETPSPRPPNASSPGPNATRWQTASGSGTSGTIRRSLPLEDCQYHVAVEAERFTPKGEIGRFRFPPMVVAQVEVRGGIDLELRALQWLFGDVAPEERVRAR